MTVPTTPMWWFEVWCDAQDLPWLLILAASSDGRFRIYDAVERNSPPREFDSYEEATDYLLEDEFSRVDGRITPDEWPPPSLGQVIARLSALAPNQLIFSKRPWTDDSEARVDRLIANSPTPPGLSERGFERFLSVEECRRVLTAFTRPRPVSDQVRLLIFYAENHALPDWVSD